MADPTTKAISGNAIKNNGGTLRYGGNAAVNAQRPTITNVPSLTEFAWYENRGGSRVPPALSLAQQAANAGLTGDQHQFMHQPISGGTYAVMAKGQYLTRRIATQIAGLANTTLLSGASNWSQRRSIFKTLQDRFTQLSAWSWTSSSAGATRQTVPTITNTYTNINTAFATDNAAAPSRAVPGQLVYRDGSPTPKQDNYKAKTE